MFCHEIGLDYVSCSPFRVPIARLAAAQAAWQSSRKSRNLAGACQDFAPRIRPGRDSTFGEEWMKSPSKTA